MFSDVCAYLDSMHIVGRVCNDVTRSVQHTHMSGLRLVCYKYNIFVFLVWIIYKAVYPFTGAHVRIGSIPFSISCAVFHVVPACLPNAGDKRGHQQVSLCVSLGSAMVLTATIYLSFLLRIAWKSQVLHHIPEGPRHRGTKIDLSSMHVHFDVSFAFLCTVNVGSRGCLGNYYEPSVNHQLTIIQSSFNRSTINQPVTYS